MSGRIDRVAKLSLLVALLLAVAGLYLQHGIGAAFWGGLLLACGEAALIGGLADWFAVRALFVHPLGLPFPHTAIIPRNRRRITREISELVLKEWLPLPLLRARLERFDFVGSGLQPLMEPLRPRLREMLRDLGRSMLSRFSPDRGGTFLSDAAAGLLEGDRLRHFLGELVRQVRERDWLDPMLYEWVDRFRQWAESPTCAFLLRDRIQSASDAYRDSGLMRMAMFNLAEAVGGVDLDQATGLIQSEIVRFVADQTSEGSPLRRVVREGLADVEYQLRNEPAYLRDMGLSLTRAPGEGPLGGMLAAMLAALQQEALVELDNEHSPLLSTALSYLDEWLARVSTDENLRAQFNAGCRRATISLLDRHHPLLGELVEEQMNRFTDEALTELIESRVGEDLNWIRLNGTFVGGLIGVVLYLLFALLQRVFARGG